MKNNYYYDIKDDLRRAPDAWAYFAWSGRNTGKTYSALKYMLETGSRFIFLKRTIEDVKLILSGSGKIGSKVSMYGADLSPFKAINRDTETNVRAFGIYKGYLGGFWHCNEKSEAEGDPIGYILALNAISKVKGFDLSECDYIIFDEFIPSPWERVDRQEGKQLLDLYMTVARDREHRGRPPLKLIGLANPTDINCPVFQELEIADHAAEMEKRGLEFLEIRGILLHAIKMSADFQQHEESMKALRAMTGTAWHDMTTGEGFAYNDTTMIKTISLKGFRCIAGVKYRRFEWYIYQRGAAYYVSKSRNNPADGMYDLNTDQDARRFYLEKQLELKAEYIEGNVIFQTFTMYDVLINYKKFFPKV